MARKMFTTLSIIGGLYVMICLIAYLLQEKLIFLPEKLSDSYEFSFNIPFDEIYVKTTDDKRLHGLLFKTNASKGLIFYLHGNAGSLASWGDVAEVYTAMGYDIFLLDYRGYGKSEGLIESEQQVYSDVQQAYNQMLNHYTEQSIIVLGYSIGTGPASWLASNNNPAMLILQAPYFSLTDIAGRMFPFIPKALVKYKFENYKHVQACKMHVVIFHGDDDEVIYTGSSEKLKDFLKPDDKLIILPGVGHNGMTYDRTYNMEIGKIL